MKDLTEGSIYRHLATMAGAIAGGMLLQTLYYVVDLYFVARLVLRTRKTCPLSPRAARAAARIACRAPA
jgi:Na+-driven multidrug efflux pump